MRNFFSDYLSFEKKVINEIKRKKALFDSILNLVKNMY